MKLNFKIGLIVFGVFMLLQNSSYAQLNLIRKIKASRTVLEDQGITNEVHRKYVGQIVFSNEKISFTKPDETKFKKNFTTNDWIFGRFYLPESMQNSIRKEKKEIYKNLYYYYDLYVDGSKVNWIIEKGELYGKYIQRTTQQLRVYTKEGSNRSEWKKIVNNLSPGVHVFKVDLRAELYSKHFSTIFATGSFNLTVKKGDKVKIGKSYSTIQAGMKNKELEARALSSIQKHAKKLGWSETFTKVKIKSDDWYIIHNKYSGVTTGRSIIVYCFASWPDGHCTVQCAEFKQQYDGQHYSKGLYFIGIVGGTQEKIDCE